MSPPDPNATRTVTTPLDPWETVAYGRTDPDAGDPLAEWPAGLTRYQPLRALGRGGMGTVHLCHDRQLDRQVAVKFPALGRADRSNFVLGEARSAARLHHPNICPVFDADVCDGVPYLTMAYIDGPTLADELVRCGTCRPHFAARLVRAVADAMSYAHSNGVIHRDLKPANILLNADREPVVTDFGLAVRQDQGGPSDGVIAGTPHYMAPEQWAGDAAAIGERSDIFALGVILFQMLTGRVPFDGSAHQVRDRVRSEPIPSVRQFRKDVPADLARIVAKATARNPADRFRDMAAFAEALTKYLRVEQAPKTKSRAWVFWLVAIPAGAMLGLCLLTCGLGMVLPLIQKMRNGAKAPPAASAVEQTRMSELTSEGKALAEQGLLEPALARYTEAVELDPTDPSPRLGRAPLLERLKRYDEAFDDWSAAVRTDRTWAFPRFKRADLLIRLKRSRDALTDLDALVASDPKNAVYLTLRGEARYELAEYTDALTDLNAAIRSTTAGLVLDLDTVSEQLPVAYYLRALTKHAMNDHAGAEPDMAFVRAHEAGLSGRFRERFVRGPWEEPDKK